MINKLEICENDLYKLKGKYIIEVNNDDHDPFKNQSKGFLMEKRISQIVSYESRESCGYLLAGFYYNHSKILKNKDFIDKINNCTDGRHFRLLTIREFKILSEWLLEELMEL